MKIKIKLSIVAVTALVMATIILSRCKQKDPGIESAEKFLNLFTLMVQSKQAEGLPKLFDMPQRKAIVNQFINLICGKTGYAKLSAPIFTLSINADDNQIKASGRDMALATIPVKFSRDSMDTKSSTLLLKLRKGKNSDYKIIDIDAAAMLKDYVAYENLVHSKTLTDSDIYSPQTLAAFKIAKELKVKYDSIPWFQHIGDKTYYTVVKGNMNLYEVFADEMGMRKGDTIAAYKMGLVGPDQKEIIPLQFDLLHNIGGTFPDMIEVEKDHKRGFYDITGKLALPVEYDQIFPLEGNGDKAVLRKGDDYYWWRKDGSISDKDPGLKIAQVLPRIKMYGQPLKLNQKSFKDVTEFNSHELHTSIYIPASYLVDWNLFPVLQQFENPLRKYVEYEDGGSLYELKFDHPTESASWLSSAFQSITEDYLGGRGGLYTHKNVLVIDGKTNRVFGHKLITYLEESEGDGLLTKGACQITNFKPISDSLYQIVLGADTYHPLYDGSVINGAPEYHYLFLKNNNLIELPDSRLFGFTKYVNLNDVYLTGCYEFQDKRSITKATKPMLEYMKNEIFAEYKYKFRDTTWARIFGQEKDDKLNSNVDDSLTAIDKYNIAFINQKLKELSNKGKMLAAK